MESVRPEYDFVAMQVALKGVESKLRKVKHVVNVFNSTIVLILCYSFLSVIRYSSTLKNMESRIGKKNNIFVGENLGGV